MIHEMDGCGGRQRWPGRRSDFTSLQPKDAGQLRVVAAVVRPHGPESEGAPPQSPPKFAAWVLEIDSEADE